jgi:hypothetical protein
MTWNGPAGAPGPPNRPHPHRHGASSPPNAPGPGPVGYPAHPGAAARPPVRHARPAGSRFRRTDLRNLPLIVVLALAATGLGYASAVPPHWLRGVMLLAIAMVLAGVFRLLLPARQAGLLVVRGRLVDAFCYAGGGAAIILFGLALPR